MRNLSFLIFVLAACNSFGPRIKTYPAPKGEPRSVDFQMTVNEQPVFVYQAKVSKYPVNQLYPGYQRPISQTEIASFAYFDFEGEVTLCITSASEIKTVNISPREFGIVPVVKGNTIELKLSEPLQFSIEVNGYHHALHIFANPLETGQIDKDDPKVHYFGAGIHEAGEINVPSGETVYIDGGAVVYGYISSENARDIRIAGRGILDASKIERGEAPAMISLNKVINASVSGIILRDSQEWAVIPFNCDSIIFDNLKLIGFWRYNSDGVDIVSCKNIQFKNSFIRSFDDNFVIRGTRRGYTEPYTIIENIIVDNCVFWNDWGRAIEIGCSVVIDTIKNVTFSNCQIPHFTAVALDIQNCDRGYIKDIRFEDIAIEGFISDSLTIGSNSIVPRAWGKIAVLGIYSTFYSADTVQGNICDIYFNNIRYYRSPKLTDSLVAVEPVIFDKNIILKDYDEFIRDNIYFGDIEFNTTHDAMFYFSGFDSIHQIKNVFIKDFFVDGEKVIDPGIVGKNEFVQNISMY